MTVWQGWQVMNKAASTSLAAPPWTRSVKHTHVLSWRQLAVLGDTGSEAECLGHTECQWRRTHERGHQDLPMWNGANTQISWFWSIFYFHCFKKNNIQNKRKMSNLAAAPSLLGKIQLDCWFILAARSFLCIEAENCPDVMCPFFTVSTEATTEGSYHFWTHQQKLYLHLEQISIACSFLWFGLGNS